MDRAGWIIVRRIVSAPFWVASGLFLMVVCVAWLPFFEEVGTGIFLTSIYGIIAIGLLLPALLLWGRQYLEFVTCFYLIGVGGHVAIFSGFTWLIAMGFFDGLAPDDFDFDLGKRMAIGSVIAAAVPNIETHTPVDDEDSRKNVLRTAGTNVMEMDDTAGQEGFLMTNRRMSAVRQMRARPRKVK